MPAIKRKAGLPAPVSSGSAKRQATKDSRAQADDDDSQARAMMQAAMEDDMMDESSDGSGEDSDDGGSEDEEDLGDEAGAAFEDLEDEAGPSKVPKTKGKGRGTADLYRPPTAEEMRTLREAADRGGSYDFGMKVRPMMLARPSKICLTPAFLARSTPFSSLPCCSSPWTPRTAPTHPRRHLQASPPS